MVPKLELGISLWLKAHPETEGLLISYYFVDGIGRFADFFPHEN